MYVSLYRRYRPQRFSEVVGQDAATRLLRSSFAEGRLGHAYLFSGPRGCGKTTAARLLAKLVNCAEPSEDGEPCCVCDSCRSVVSGEHMDVMEIDGASNRGIDQIRELKSHVGLSSFMGGTKVYILDEVHMLTTEAFNALLKTLEEPPSSVMFLFATTEPHKVPVTIRSRCQHIPFHKISTEDTVAHLSAIASAEGFAAEEAALWEISRNADGALRDALSLTEQGVALGNGSLSMDAVRGLFGGGSRAEVERWVCLLRTSMPDASAVLKDMLASGVSPERFLEALYPLLRDMLVFGLWGERAFAGTSLSEAEKTFLRTEVPNWDNGCLRRAAAYCSSLFPRARWGLRSDVFAGLLLLGMLDAMDEPSPPAAAPEVGRTARVPDAAPERAPVRPDAGVRKRAPGGNATPARMEPVPAPQRETPRAADEAATEPPPGLPEAFASLWADNLPLCAAMIDVGISRTEAGLVFDYTDASPVARALLETPRARMAIERAFGLAEAPRSRSGQAAPEARSHPAFAQGMSVAEISAYLGADLLVSKRTSREEDISDLPDSPDLGEPGEGA